MALLKFSIENPEKYNDEGLGDFHEMLQVEGGGEGRPERSDSNYQSEMLSSSLRSSPSQSECLFSTSSFDNSAPSLVEYYNRVVAKEIDGFNYWLDLDKRRACRYVESDGCCVVDENRPPLPMGLSAGEVAQNLYSVGNYDGSYMRNTLLFGVQGCSEELVGSEKEAAMTSVVAENCDFEGSCTGGEGWHCTRGNFGVAGGGCYIYFDKDRVWDPENAVQYELRQVRRGATSEAEIEPIQLVIVITKLRFVSLIAKGVGTMGENYSGGWGEGASCMKVQARVVFVPDAYFISSSLRSSPNLT